MNHLKTWGLKQWELGITSCGLGGPWIQSGHKRNGLSLLHSVWGPQLENSKREGSIHLRVHSFIYMAVDAGCWLVWSTETPPRHGLSLACLPYNMTTGFQEPGESCIAFYDLTLEVTWHHFHHILLVNMKIHPISRGGNRYPHFSMSHCKTSLGNGRYIDTAS